jgi:hypothetical protein
MLLRIIIAALLLLVLALAWLLKAEMTTSQERQDQIEKLTLRLADKSRRENLELQEKCALQAERMFRILGYEGGYVSHYNAELNRCFMTVDTGTIRPLRITKFLYDAYEQRQYAGFQLTGNSRNPPDVCALKSPGEKRKLCKSVGEYEAFVARYME